MQNPLNSLSSLFSKKGQSVVGVDIGVSSIKVVQLRKHKGRALLETYGELALGPYASLEIGRATNLPAEKLADALKDLLREATVTSKLTGMAIPISSSLISLMEMPALDEKQLAQMIPIEARKYIPVSVQDVTLDWWIIPKENEHSWYMEGKEQGAVKRGGMVDVLLVAILNAALEKYRAIVKVAGLQCSFFEIEVFSTLRSVLDQDVTPVMIADIGAGSTKLSIMERGVVRVSHVINRGSQDITLAISRSLSLSVAEAENKKRELGLMGVTPDGKQIASLTEAVVQFIFSEANRVLLGYQKKFNKNVSKVVLTGGGATLKGILVAARSNLETEVVLADPFSKVEAPAFLEPVLKNAGPEFAVALGIALRRLSEIE